LSVLVIDDSPMPRYAARAMLDATATFRVTAEAVGGREGLRIFAKVRPQVVLVDVDMPDMDGAQTTRSILELGDPTPVVVAWTVSDASDDLIRMIHAGCRGYALKDFGPTELENALLAAVRGELSIPRRLLPDIIAKALATPKRREEEFNLTPRELDVLTAVGDGKAAKEVGAELHISKRSVDAHLRSIYRKLDVTNRVQAVNKARAFGLIGADA
jgi:DNA-binding NarL/FixJ family response regulator